MNDIKVFACNSAEEFTKEICDNLGIEMGQKDSFKFANDNNFVQLKETVREKDVYIVQTTQPPVNERIMELLITVEAAKRAGARRVTAVLPYFMYSRSDKKDQSRVPVTAKLMATLLEAAGVDHVLTCDLHNPAIQAYFNIICDRVTAKHLLEKYFQEKQIKDTDIQTSRYCGIYCIYTKTRCKGFTFHHIQLSNDVETTTTPDGTTEEPGTDIPDNPATPELPENVRGMLLFNELMYDNASDGAEYIELYTPTDTTLNIPALYLYKMYEDGKVYSTTTLQHKDSSLPLTIPAKGYLCFTKYVNIVIQKHKVGQENLMEISKFPALNHAGG